MVNPPSATSTAPASRFAPTHRVGWFSPTAAAANPATTDALKQSTARAGSGNRQPGTGEPALPARGTHGLLERIPDPLHVGKAHVGERLERRAVGLGELTGHVVKDEPLVGLQVQVAGALPGRRAPQPPRLWLAQREYPAVGEVQDGGGEGGAVELAAGRHQVHQRRIPQVGRPPTRLPILLHLPEPPHAAAETPVAGDRQAPPVQGEPASG